MMAGLTPVLLCVICVAGSVCVAACPTGCTCHEARVHCYGKQLRDIPKNIPADTIYLNLASNHLETINPERLSHLTALTELLLGDNNIRNIQPGTFTGLSSLETLNLNSNMLTSLPPGLFDGMGNLSSILITNNKIVNIEGAFRNLSNVKRMDLGGNQIQALTDNTFQGMKNLVYLMMPDNNIKKISSNSFVPLQSLTYIVLKKNSIKDGNRLFIRNHRLSYIDLTGCSLKEVPMGLPWATRYLQLSNNNITRINKSTFSGTRHLSIIALDENQITRIEKGAFSGIRELQELWLNANKLKKIPSPFSPKLTKLHISKNRISKISRKDFPKNSALSVLSLSSNMIKTIKPGTFSQSKFLTELSLSGNKIANLQTGVFAELGEIQTLSLNNNKITRIQKGSLSGLTTLTKLEMAFIVDIETNVEGNIFADMPNLQFLDLQLSPAISAQVLGSDDMMSSLSNVTHINLMDNELTSLNPNLRTYLRSVQQIKIAGNKWHCDKRLQWLSAWMKSHKKLFFMGRNVECHTPSSLKGLPLSILKPFQFAAVTTTVAPPSTTALTPATEASTTQGFATSRPPKKATVKKSKPKGRPLTTAIPPTKIVLTKMMTKIVTQRFFVFPSTTPKPKVKKSRKTRKPKKTTTQFRPQTTMITTSTMSRTRKTPNKVITTKSPYTQQITSGMLTGTSVTPTLDDNSLTSDEDTLMKSSTDNSLNISNPGTPMNSSDDLETGNSSNQTSQTTNSSDSDPSKKAAVSTAGGVDMKTVIVATCVTAAVILIILGVIIFFVIRYRQNKLVYHRALQYRQDYKDVVFFVGEPMPELMIDTKQRAVRSRSDRGSTSSRPSEDITNDLAASMKVYTWDDE
ncbi:leucine-rich repeat-containing protein 4C-like [Haliotis rufescens]|uniref:leucine-rich repeat-containing protein 4C-like n=1 Tax=Haliotis rufescens TaxID=6454 RepID=UPI001EB0452E|nr:leucine-rich repeat-containing protein 4C-like [Haliotis rufescens]